MVIAKEDFLLLATFFSARIGRRMNMSSSTGTRSEGLRHGVLCCRNKFAKIMSPFWCVINVCREFLGVRASPPHV